VISAREVYASLRAAAAGQPQAKRAGTTAFLNELVWREFYYHVLHHFPHVLTEAFRPEFRRIRWRNDPAHFDAWKEGRTGYPIVDAAMRQLAATGWMHNRARMVVASFLTKDLHIDWRWGEEHFFRHLIDGDIASNNGGWQWCAGTGTDASPWFRIFNPTLQGRKFDPTGSFIRRWVPELEHVPSRSIHAPWNSGGETAYPGPIVRHEEARALTMALYRKGAG
jgi:deoxyribodipyrimidine photo-lyase